MKIRQIIPRDERGRIRRFTGHGEALKSIFTAGGLFCLTFSVPLVVRISVYFFDGGESRMELLSSASVFAALIVFVLGACIVTYAALFLAGGVMSREERERKQNSLPR